MKLKKLTLLLSVVFLAGGLSVRAQEVASSGTPEANYSILEGKLKRSDASIDDIKKNQKPGFWLSRAELMMDIFYLNRQYLFKGAEYLTVKFIYPNPKETKTWQKDGSRYDEYIYDKVTITCKDGKVDGFVETSVLHSNPLEEAIKSMEKAVELDVEKKETKDIKKNYERLKRFLANQAGEQFEADKFKDSYITFQEIMKINDKPVMEGVIDTVFIYYAGMAASKADLPKDAIKYYELTRSFNFDDPNLYVFLKQKYFEVGDTAKGVAIIQEGLKKYPENQAVMIELINYYLAAGEADGALNYLTLAQEKDPNNLSYIFAEATLYDKQGLTDKALATYQKCIEKDPKYFNAYFNIGVMYYNKAVRLYEDANTINNPKEYDIAKKAADDVLAKALPYVEKAHELDPKDVQSMETLKTLYYRLQMNDLYEAIKKEMESTQGGVAPKNN